MQHYSEACFIKWNILPPSLHFSEAARSLQILKHKIKIPFYTHTHARTHARRTIRVSWYQKGNKWIFPFKMCNTHACLTALCPGLPGSAGTRKVKPTWILLKQETVSGSGISLAICKITTPAPHHSVFYMPDALPATQPTASEYWISFE